MKVWVVSRMQSDCETVTYKIIGVYKNPKTHEELSDIELDNIIADSKMSHIMQDEFEIED